MSAFPVRRTILALAFYLVWSSLLPGQTVVPSNSEPSLTAEQIETFLRTAKVIDSREAKKGITHTLRLTLSDGKITHDASFQSEDFHRAVIPMADGHTELNFTDSYRYNIAGYRLAQMLGLDDMVPVYVERSIQGMTGSLSWWVRVKMDAADRLARNVEVPPEAVDRWNNQMYKIRVFNQLIYDDDANLTNVLVTDDWKLWRIDFSRAFRLHKNIREYKNLDHCDRQLLEKMKTLKEAELKKRTKHFLTGSEVAALMARRDKIVAHIQKEIAEKGEDQVLY